MMTPSIKEKTTKCIACSTRFLVKTQRDKYRRERVYQETPNHGEEWEQFLTRLEDGPKSRVTVCHSCFVNQLYSLSSVTLPYGYCVLGHTTGLQRVVSPRGPCCIDCLRRDIRRLTVEAHRCSCARTPRNFVNLQWNTAANTWDGVYTGPTPFVCSVCQKLRECPDCCREGVDTPCENCSGAYRLHRWNYRRNKLKFKQHEKDHEVNKYGLYFGVELEVHVGGCNNIGRCDCGVCTDKKHNTVASIMKEACNNSELDFFTMEDGSTNPGWEVVTHPSSFKFLMEGTHKLWDLISLAKQKYSDVNDKFPLSGVHVHLNRRSFTKLHEFKFIRWVYGNIGFMRYINGRDFLAQYCLETPDFQYLPTLLKRGYRVGSSRSRYHLVNLENQRTIELRGFNSVLDVNIIKAYIQFCDALYFHTLNSSMQDTQIKSFLNMIHKQKDKYKELISYIETFPKKAFKEQDNSKLLLRDKSQVVKKSKLHAPLTADDVRIRMENLPTPEWSVE